MRLLALGIDIAKLKFNVCLIKDDGRLRHNRHVRARQRAAVEGGVAEK